MIWEFEENVVNFFNFLKSNAFPLPVWPSSLRATGIEAEWRKTLCMPREVCLEVGKEFGAPTNTFFKPPCVSVYRCGGCCNSEELQCMNITTSFVSKTVSLGVIIIYSTEGASMVFAVMLTFFSTLSHQTLINK